MPTESESEKLDVQDFINFLQETISKQEKQISQWREVAVLEGIALALTIYFYVL